MAQKNLKKPYSEFYFIKAFIIIIQMNLKFLRYIIIISFQSVPKKFFYLNYTQHYFLTNNFPHIFLPLSNKFIEIRLEKFFYKSFNL